MKGLNEVRGFHCWIESRISTFLVIAGSSQLQFGEQFLDGEDGSGQTECHMLALFA